MCLTIKMDSETKTAKEAIVCYKSLDDRHNSSIMGYKYLKGEVQAHVDIQISEYEVNRGYHSWKSFFGGGGEVFIIPRGASYIEGMQYNRQKGYVSSSIIWVGSKWSLSTWQKVSNYKLK